MITLDNPLVRASAVCPLCNGSKPSGLVTCWSCYRSARLRDGNQHAEERIARREAALQEEQVAA